MTKGAALQSFFERFSLTAYPVTAVPSDATFPYLTYAPVFGAWGDGELNITVNLWYYTDSEAVPSAKADEISETIGLSGIQVPCDGGFIWFKRGSPWCQSLKDEQNPNVKRRYINVIVEYNTIN